MTRRRRPATWAGFIAIQVVAVAAWGLMWRLTGDSWSEAIVITLIAGGVGSFVAALRFSARRPTKPAHRPPTHYVEL